MSRGRPSFKRVSDAIQRNQQLNADFEAYLDGFSPNVQAILENFEFRNQIPRLSKADALGTLIEKLLSPDINLSPNPVLSGDGSVGYRVKSTDNESFRRWMTDAVFGLTYDEPAVAR